MTDVRINHFVEAKTQVLGERRFVLMEQSRGNNLNLNPLKASLIPKVDP